MFSVRKWLYACMFLLGCAAAEIASPAGRPCPLASSSTPLRKRGPRA
ncbi:hypothetical protein [Comamonas sp.]|jgi:hypothetical protein|nr:hypothetical protein [Comamonas sp.]